MAIILPSCRRQHTMYLIPVEELQQYQIQLGDWLRCRRCGVEALVPLETVVRRDRQLTQLPEA